MNLLKFTEIPQDRNRYLIDKKKTYRKINNDYSQLIIKLIINLRPCYCL